MAVVESGYAGTRQNTPRVLPEEEEQQEGMVQEEAVMDEEGDMEQGLESVEDMSDSSSTALPCPLASTLHTGAHR